jgi:hypothetical protein
MANETLDAALSAYLARPVTGERLPVDWKLSMGLVGVLGDLARERGMPVEAVVEYALFKALRAEKARLLVGEAPDPIPASFLNDRVATAKVELEKDKAAREAAQEGRGDRASRMADAMEAALKSAQAPDEHLEAVQRSAALGDAMIDQALNRKR